MFHPVTHFFSLRGRNAAIPPQVPDSFGNQTDKTMNLTKKTILALGLLAVAGAGYAQTATTAQNPVGLLGQSYSEVSFGVTDIKHFSKDQYSLGVGANVPVTPYLDLGASYDYSWLRGLGHVNTIAGGATAYTTFNGVKPFATAALGYEWQSFPGYRDDQADWGFAAGVEIPVSVITVTPRIAYADDFRGSNRSSQQWSYAVEGNYWVTKTAAVFASVGYVDVNHTNNDGWAYTVGARFKF